MSLRCTAVLIAGIFSAGSGLLMSAASRPPKRHPPAEAARISVNISSAATAGDRRIVLAVGRMTAQTGTTSRILIDHGRGEILAPEPVNRTARRAVIFRPRK